MLRTFVRSLTCVWTALAAQTVPPRPPNVAAWRVDTVVVAPAGRFHQGHGPVPIDMSGWGTMRQAPAPLWEQRPDQPLWWTYLPDSRTLYVCMRAPRVPSRRRSSFSAS